MRGYGTFPRVQISTKRTNPNFSFLFADALSPDGSSRAHIREVFSRQFLTALTKLNINLSQRLFEDFVKNKAPRDWLSFGASYETNQEYNFKRLGIRLTGISDSGDIGGIRGRP